MPHRSARAAPARRRAPKKKRSSVPDGERFHCPYPGCERSCAELWRLKVHYRAPSHIRGSGVERGHGAELEFCPKCKEHLEPGKHHFGCRSGLAAPRQAVHRRSDAKKPAKKRAGSKRLAARGMATRRASAEARRRASPETETVSRDSLSLFAAADSPGVSPVLPAKLKDEAPSPGIFSSRSHNSDLESFCNFDKSLEAELDALLCDNEAGVQALDAADDIFTGMPLLDCFTQPTDMESAPPLSSAEPSTPSTVSCGATWAYTYYDLEQHEMHHMQKLGIAQGASLKHADRQGLHCVQRLRNNLVASFS